MKKSIKKVNLSIILISILLFVSGCQSKVNLAKFNVMPKSNTEKAREYIYTILEAAGRSDEDAIYDLFSEKVKEELGEEELRSQIKELSHFYQGTEIQSREGVVDESTSNDYGVKRIRIKVLYGVITDNGHYEINFTYISRSDENPEEEGFECFQIAKKETVDGTPEFMWADYDIYHGILIFE